MSQTIAVTVLVLTALIKDARSSRVLFVVRPTHSVLHGEVGIRSCIKPSSFRIVLSIVEAFALCIALISDSRGHVHDLMENGESQRFLRIRLLEGQITDSDVCVGDFLVGFVTPCLSRNKGQNLFLPLTISLVTTRAFVSSTFTAAHDSPESFLVEHHFHGSFVSIFNVGVIILS